MTSSPVLSRNHIPSPAEEVLAEYLADALAPPARTSGVEFADRQSEIDLRTDILYVLTDKIAHRRALPFSLLVEEVAKLQIRELSLSELTLERIVRSLHALIQQRLVREFETADENHYELAHDFLVRSVVNHFHELDRRRIAGVAVLRQKREVADAELARLSIVSRSISVVLRSLPIASFILSTCLIFFGIQETAPSGIGLSYLWFIAVPAFALGILGGAARRPSAVVLSVLILIGCVGTWLYELSLPSTNISSYIEVAAEQECDRLISSIAPLVPSGVVPSDVLPSTLYVTCRKSLISKDYANMVYNAAHSFSGPQGDFCYDAATLFGSDWIRNKCARERDMWRARLLEAPKRWAADFTVRPYHLNHLDSLVSLYALMLALAHVICYPAILLGTGRKPVFLAGVRRLWAEILDVVLLLAVLLLVAYVNERSRFFLYEAPWLLVIVVGGYISMSTILLNKTGSTLGGFISKVKTTDVKGNGAIPLWKAFLRQSILAAWAFLNLFFGVPSLLLTPLYLSLRPSHQLFYDSFFKLATEPAAALKSPSVVSEPPEITTAKPEVAQNSAR